MKRTKSAKGHSILPLSRNDAIDRPLVGLQGNYNAPLVLTWIREKLKCSRTVNKNILQPTHLSLGLLTHILSSTTTDGSTKQKFSNVSELYIEQCWALPGAYRHIYLLKVLFELHAGRAILTSALREKQKRLPK